VKTGRRPLSVLQVNFTFDKGLTDPDELLDRYFTPTGWSAAPVAVVQHFYRDVRVARNGIEYTFRSARLPEAVAAGDAADYACARAVGRRDLSAERARLADHFAQELNWNAPSPSCRRTSRPLAPARRRRCCAGSAPLHGADTTCCTSACQI
jgi:hypothetical protein